MPKQRVVVKIHLRIERKQPAVTARNKRVDLHQRGISLLKSLVQTRHEFHGLIDLLGPESKLECQLSSLKRFEFQTRRNVLLQDRIGVLSRNLLNFHSASQ